MFLSHQKMVMCLIEARIGNISLMNHGSWVDTNSGLTTESTVRTQNHWRLLDDQRPSISHAPPHRPNCSRFISGILRSLEPWEVSLFGMIELGFPPHEIVRYLTDVPFLGVSDGSVKFKCSAFRWMLCRTNGQHLVWCASLAYGVELSSLTAEEYGFLSVLRFLRRLAKYCGTPQIYGCTLASNNLGLIEHIKDLGSVSYPTPSLSLAPDWDIVNEI